ncbi:hypothetical protein PMIN06_002264 [Paraphaeosphaeria minitans]
MPGSSCRSVASKSWLQWLQQMRQLASRARNADQLQYLPQPASSNASTSSPTSPPPQYHTIPTLLRLASPGPARCKTPIYAAAFVSGNPRGQSSWVGDFSFRFLSCGTKRDDSTEVESVFLR